MEVELVKNNKIRSDDYVSLLIIFSYLLYGLFFRLEAFVGIVTYPFAALSAYGIIKIVNGLNKINNGGYIKINKILLGIIYIIISVSFLTYILLHPNITFHIIIALIAFPMMLVAFAGIIKGLIIDMYSLNQRIINIIVGIITLVICLITFFSMGENFIFNIIALFLTIFLNTLSRAALYLSEYGLSVWHLRNFILFLYIISDYIISMDRSGNLILEKMYK